MPIIIGELLERSARLAKSIHGRKRTETREACSMHTKTVTCQGWNGWNRPWFIMTLCIFIRAQNIFLFGMRSTVDVVHETLSSLSCLCVHKSLMRSVCCGLLSSTWTIHAFGFVLNCLSHNISVCCKRSLVPSWWRALTRRVNLHTIRFKTTRRVIIQSICIALLTRSTVSKINGTRLVYRVAEVSEIVTMSCTT